MLAVVAEVGVRVLVPRVRVGVLVAMALRTDRAAAMRRVFTFSIYYLLALFVAMMADKLL